MSLRRGIRPAFVTVTVTVTTALATGCSSNTTATTSSDPDAACPNTTATDLCPGDMEPTGRCTTECALCKFGRAAAGWSCGAYRGETQCTHGMWKQAATCNPPPLFDTGVDVGDASDTSSSDVSDGPSDGG